MRMILTIKGIDNCIYKHRFRTKRECDEVVDSILKNSDLYRCIWIEPESQPHKRERIDLNMEVYHESTIHG